MTEFLARALSFERALRFENALCLREYHRLEHRDSRVH